MVIPSAGEIVLVPFPFSDLSASKVRPVICLANVGRDDLILCQITSNSYGDPSALPLTAADFAARQLLVQSFARPGKLFTANASLIVRSVGRLNPVTFKSVLDAAVQLLSSAS